MNKKLLFLALVLVCTQAWGSGSGGACVSGANSAGKGCNNAPNYRDDILYCPGDRVIYGGVLYQAKQTDDENFCNNPCEVVDNLWTAVEVCQECVNIDKFYKAAGHHYDLEDLVYYNNNLYIAMWWVTNSPVEGGAPYNGWCPVNLKCKVTVTTINNCQNDCSPNGSVEVNFKGSQLITADAGENCKVTHIEVNGVSIVIDDRYLSYTLTNIKVDTTVEIFCECKVTVTVDSDCASFSPAGSTQLDIGDDLTITAAAGANCRVKDYSIGGTTTTVKAATVSIPLTNIQTDKTVQINCECQAKYDVSKNSDCISVDKPGENFIWADEAPFTAVVTPCPTCRVFEKEIDGEITNLATLLSQGKGLADQQCSLTDENAFVEGSEHTISFKCQCPFKFKVRSDGCKEVGPSEVLVWPGDSVNAYAKPKSGDRVKSYKINSGSSTSVSSGNNQTYNKSFTVNGDMTVTFRCD